MLKEAIQFIITISTVISLEDSKKNKIDLITFTNVFAHIDNLNLLILNLKKVLSKNTTIIIENHYMGSVLQKNQFDTFYHEHPRTYSLKSFIFLYQKG